MPIRDGRQRIFAVVPLLNKRGCEGFTAADERAFSEFARPLAVILETSSRVAWSPTPGMKAYDTFGNAATEHALKVILTSPERQG